MKFLNSKQELALNLLAKSPLQGRFYWTGGTLLAHHYLRHRLSLDLDFFSEEEFTFSQLEPWVKDFSQKAGFKKVTPQKIFDRWEFIFTNQKEELRIEFVHFDHQKKTLKKSGFTIKNLLALVEKKFSLTFTEDLFLSEAFKTLALLSRIKPLMIEETGEEKERVLEEIKKYFEEKSTEFLGTVIT